MKFLFFIVVSVILSESVGAEDLYYCVDYHCKEPISFGKTVLLYHARTNIHLSFTKNEDVRILSKPENGGDEWIAAIRGKIGVVPKSLIREEKMSKYEQLFKYPFEILPIWNKEKKSEDSQENGIKPNESGRSVKSDPPINEYRIEEVKQEVVSVSQDVSYSSSSSSSSKPSNSVITDPIESYKDNLSKESQPEKFPQKDFTIEDFAEKPQEESQESDAKSNVEVKDDEVDPTPIKDSFDSLNQWFVEKQESFEKESKIENIEKEDEGTKFEFEEDMFEDSVEIGEEDDEEDEGYDSQAESDRVRREMEGLSDGANGEVEDQEETVTLSKKEHEGKSGNDVKINPKLEESSLEKRNDETGETGDSLSKEQLSGRLDESISIKVAAELPKSHVDDSHPHTPHSEPIINSQEILSASPIQSEEKLERSESPPKSIDQETNKKDPSSVNQKHDTQNDNKELGSISNLDKEKSEPQAIKYTKMNENEVENNNPVKKLPEQVSVNIPQVSVNIPQVSNDGADEGKDNNIVNEEIIENAQITKEEPTVILQTDTIQSINADDKGNFNDKESEEVEKLVLLPEPDQIEEKVELENKAELVEPLENTLEKKEVLQIPDEIPVTIMGKGVESMDAHAQTVDTEITIQPAESTTMNDVVVERVELGERVGSGERKEDESISPIPVIGDSEEKVEPPHGLSLDHVEVAHGVVEESHGQDQGHSHQNQGNLDSRNLGRGEEGFDHDHEHENSTEPVPGLEKGEQNEPVQGPAKNHDELNKDDLGLERELERELNQGHGHEHWVGIQGQEEVNRSEGSSLFLVVKHLSTMLVGFLPEHLQDTILDVDDALVFTGIIALTLISICVPYFFIETFLAVRPLKRKVVELNKNLWKVSTAYENQQDEYETLKKKAYAFDADKGALQKAEEELKELRSKVVKQKKDLHLLQKEIKSSAKVASEVENLVDTTMKDKNNAFEESKKLKAALITLQEDFKTMEEELNSVSNEASTLKMDLDLERHSVETLNMKNATLEKALAEIKDKLGSEIEKRRKAEEDFEIISNDKKSIENELSDFKMILQNFEKSQDDLTNEIIQKENQILALKETLEEDSPLIEFAEMKSLLKNAESQLANMKLQAEELTIEKERISGEYSDAKKILMTIQTEKDQAENRLKVLESWFKEKEDELRTAVEKYEVENSVGGKDKDDLIQMIADKDKELKGLGEMIDALKREFEETKLVHRNELRALEAKGHENWLSLCQSERRAQDARKEAELLREKLLTLAKDKEDGNSNGDMNFIPIIPPDMVPLPLGDELDHAPLFGLGDFFPPPPLPLDDGPLERTEPLGRLSPAYSDDDDDDLPRRRRRSRGNYSNHSSSSSPHSRHDHRENYGSMRRYQNHGKVSPHVPSGFNL